MKVSERMKRWISLVLCLCMLVQYVPMTAHAAHEDNLCEHHPAHTADCGYAAAVEGADCTHQHDDTCGEAAAEEGCTHSHDESCGYVQAREESPCTWHCEVCDHAAHAEEVISSPAMLSEEAAETVSISLTSSDCGVAIDKTTAALGESVTINLTNSVSDAPVFVYSYKNGNEDSYEEYNNLSSITISNVAGDIEIKAVALLDVKVNLNGGTVSNDEKFDSEGKMHYSFGWEYNMPCAAYGEYILPLEDCFEKEGCTLIGAKDSDGNAYPIDTGFTLTDDLTLDLVWECHHTVGTKLKDNGDGTHSSICASECGEVYSTSDHDFTYDATNHKCECGALETFTVSLSSEDRGVKIVSVNGEAVAEGETACVEYGKAATIVLENTVSSDNDVLVLYTIRNAETGWNTSFESFEVSESFTIDNVTGEVLISADALLNVKVNLNGGTVSNDEKFDSEGKMQKTYYDCGNTEKGAYYGGTIPALNTCFEREGYTLTGATGSDGKTYAASDSVPLTGDLTLDLIWQCNHGSYEYTVNTDGTTPEPAPRAAR